MLEDILLRIAGVTSRDSVFQTVKDHHEFLLRWPNGQAAAAYSLQS